MKLSGLSDRFSTSLSENRNETEDDTLRVYIASISTGDPVEEEKTNGGRIHDEVPCTVLRSKDASLIRR